VSDIRYACRSLARTPGFTLVALLTLALGIGGTTAIFSIVDGILLRPLPYPDPAAIVSLARTDAAGRNDAAFSAADFIDYQREVSAFRALAGYRQDIFDLTGGAEPVRLTALETTIGFFDVLGVPPLMGRTYASRTDSSRGTRVVVISETMWRQHLGGAPNVIGRIVRMNGAQFTVIGVMPSLLNHPAKVDVWALAPQEVPTSPFPMDGDPATSRGVQYFSVIGRVAPGVSITQANQQLRGVSDRLAKEFPDSNRGEWAFAESYHDRLVGEVRNGLLILLGAVAFVLLIACANVASLLLARGTARRRELALRRALGAGRVRLVRQLLTESLLLAGFGGAIGLVVAYWGVAGLVAIAPETIPRVSDVHLDPRVAAFAVASTLVVGVLFGIFPALQGARPDMVDALKEGGRTGTARSRAQKVLVVGEVALALVLLIGAGLMLTSFSRLRSVDVGFSVSNLIVVFVPLPQSRYNNEAQARFYSQLLEKLHANPVTARSSIVFPTPFGGGNARGNYRVEGVAPESRAEQPTALINLVMPGYFQTMGIAMVSGRDVAPSDTPDRSSVVIVNQTLAAHEWPNQDAVGKRIAIGGDPESDPKAWITVIGVVADSKRSDLQAATPPAVYLPHATLTLPFMGAVVRSELSEGTVASAVREAVRSLDPDLPVDKAETIERVLQRATGQPRFRAMLITAFAIVALVLAGVGLYGLVSYTVAQRVPEIAVRLALGATPAQVGRLIVGQGLTLVVAGIVAGLTGALAVTRLLQGLLFSVSATDPVVYSALPALLLAIAAIACYVPARRAMRVDPITALRSE
jgi:putative ABC transport system permease protein